MKKFKVCFKYVKCFWKKVKNMKKICVIGAFGFEEKPTGGQPVKSRTLYYELVNKYGTDCVSFVDTYKWRKRPLRMICGIIKNAACANVFIMLPAHNGVKVFSKMLYSLKRIKKIKIFYSVIGGWLPELLAEDNRLVAKLKKFDGVWVETSSMKDDLEKLGFCNVDVVRNFKRLKILKEDTLCFNAELPISVCTFSRVTQKKGIGDAIAAVCKINKERGSDVIKLDIYGEIDEGYRTDFLKMVSQAKNCVRYMGVVKPEDSVNTIKSYFALLFPTHFFTEGIPGTIIDAYSAGVPVVAPFWKNYSDVLLDKKTGYGYEFGDANGLYNILCSVIAEPKQILEMKKTCLEYAAKYTPEVAMDRINDLLVLEEVN